VAFRRRFDVDADWVFVIDDRWLVLGFAGFKRRNSADVFGFPNFVVVSLVLS
jgi:hypothetical protein